MTVWNVSRSTTSDEILVSLAARINALLEGYYSEDNPLHGALNSALFYSRRRLRASLVYLGASLYEEPLTGAVDNAAMAYEIITANYVLLDDTPILDNGTMRADRPTPRVEFGDVDALLAAAILQLEPSRLLQHSDPRIADIFYESARDTIIGLKLEEELAFKLASLENAESVTRVARWLTGPLVAGPLMTGAVLASASPDEVAALRAFGYAFGTAYQLTDHVIDVMGAEGNSGKDGFSDVLTGKASLLLYEVLVSTDEVSRAKLLGLMGTMPSPADKLWLQHVCDATGAVDRTLDRIEEWNRLARAALEPIPAGPYRTVLEELPGMYLTTLERNLRTGRAAE